MCTERMISRCIIISFLLFHNLSAISMINPPNCTLREYPCNGIKTSASSLADMLSILHNHYCGCVYIITEVEVILNKNWEDIYTFSLVERDFSFFYFVKEIRGYLVLQNFPKIKRLSLPNLRIIRGERLFETDLSLAVFNSKIHNLYMPQLTEISKGNVLFSNTPNLSSVCNVMSIDWFDILEVGTATFTGIAESCTSVDQIDCSQLQCDTCWCDDLSQEECCQILTRNCDSCGDNGRCSVDQVCCNNLCAAGCTGFTNSDCRACVIPSVFDGRSCVRECYSDKFIIHGFCVSECPPGLEYSDGYCTDGGTVASNTAIDCISDSDDSDECYTNSRDCHVQCGSYGCNGPKDTDCRQCLNYNLNGKCVETCLNVTDDTGDYFYNDILRKVCLTCDSICKNCHGEGPTGCYQCRTAYVLLPDGAFQCVSACDVDSYIANTTDIGSMCSRCSIACATGSGCSGPLSIVDITSGCHQCETVLLDETGNQVMCTHDSVCPDGYYTNTTVTSLKASLLCSPCHEMSSNETVCQDLASTSGSMGVNWLYYITAAIVVGICFFVIAGIFTFFIKRYRSKRLLISRQHNSTEPTETRESCYATTKLENKTLSSKFLERCSVEIPSEILIPNSRIILLQMVGQGEFGKVYKANFIDQDTINVVAVKTMRGGSHDAAEVNEFLKESILMKDLRHPNVMELIGICIDGDSPYIILPYLEGGSLLTYLRENKHDLNVPHSDNYNDAAKVQIFMCKVCLQVAKGMEYLVNQNLVHRDLAARNCMLDSDFTVKVSDFGLSKGLYNRVYLQQHRNTSIKLPVKWLALESIEYGEFTEKTDIWAYGITCWEIFSCGKIPYSGYNFNAMLSLLRTGKRMEKPDNEACNDELYQELMVNCWQNSAKLRPTFSQIALFLEKTLTILSGYIVLESQQCTLNDDIYI